MWRFRLLDRLWVIWASKLDKKGRGHFSLNSSRFSRKIGFFDFRPFFCIFDQKILISGVHGDFGPGTDFWWHFSLNSPSFWRKIDFFDFFFHFWAFFDQKILISGASWRFWPWDRFGVIWFSKVDKKGRGHFSPNSPSFSRKIDFFDFFGHFLAFF